MLYRKIYEMISQLLILKIKFLFFAWFLAYKIKMEHYTVLLQYRFFFLLKLNFPGDFLCIKSKE